MTPLLLGYNARNQAIKLDPDEQCAHSLYVGASGTGKSKSGVELKAQHWLRQRQGFCLLDPHGTSYDEVVAFAADHVFEQKIIPLNLSRPGNLIVGCNFFRKVPGADISVQVDRRSNSMAHVWGDKNTDHQPTLNRILRLGFTVVLQLGLGFPQMQHLFDFNSRAIRGHLIDQLANPLIQREWRELQELKAKDWRDEVLSAKNRLFKFLTSTTLCRVMGLPNHSLDFQQLMDEGTVLLVNLAPSDHLSRDNARAFGALLVNEFYESAFRRRRDEFGRPPAPYHLILDEFQDFVSLDIAAGLDQLRKFGCFFTLLCQRFGQLDE